MGEKNLDLGCGIRKRDGAIGVDIMPNECVDIVHDLNKYPYPFTDNEFDDILMDNSLEHMDSVIKTMEEVWRISKPQAKIVIKVPYFRSQYAVDPTHKSFFVSHSFYYFDPEHQFNKYYKYSKKAQFKVTKIIFDEECKYSLFGKIRFSIPKWFANCFPNQYEEYFASIFPLHNITFYLTVLK